MYKFSIPHLVFWMSWAAFFVNGFSASAQSAFGDSLQGINLNEVLLVSSKARLNHQKQDKPLSTLDEFLEHSRNVQMIKRGAYAWEPAINSMSSERLSVTIDGMQIFGACTDKMDPVTSYVDVSNLEEVQIASGQSGSSFGNNIGGAINLKLDGNKFKNTGMKASAETAYESNNAQRIFGGRVKYGSSNFYANTDVIYRKADNYKAGGGEEVLYSQYEKGNVSVNTGYKFGNGSLSANFIYDEARDVGYPALPMDVSLARAVIGGVTYHQDTLYRLNDWESKLYYNKITHIMDDSYRPDVPIRMDMPGWSETAGFYTQAHYSKNKHRFQFKWDGYYNQSLAEMTMYSPNPSEAPMFMLTWPDVHTLNTGIYVEDKISLKAGSLKLSTRLGYHSNEVKNDFGLKSLKIFYPEMKASKQRILKSFSAHYHRMISDFHLEGGLSYGERAPSVSEGYGFYLFNSFDGYDYVGNPHLKTEQSAEANLQLRYKKPLFEITADARFFRINNYIIGKWDSQFSAMTIGARGVKFYENLDYAHLMNLTLSANYSISNAFNWNGSITYHYGKENSGENLPLISPVSYKQNLSFYKNQYSASLSLEGAAAKKDVSASFGETPTAAYAVLSAAVGKRFYIQQNDLYVKAGVENILDTFYVSYSDWNNIPRMGRNIYLFLSYSLN